MRLWPYSVAGCIYLFAMNHVVNMFEPEVVTDGRVRPRINTTNLKKIFENSNELRGLIYASTIIASVCAMQPGTLVLVIFWLSILFISLYIFEVLIADWYTSHVTMYRQIDLLLGVYDLLSAIFRSSPCFRSLSSMQIHKRLYTRYRYIPGYSQ